MTGRLQHVRSVLLVAALAALWIAGAAAQPAPTSAGPPDPKLVEDLVAALDKFQVPEKEKGELLAILGPMKNAIVEG